MHVLILVLVFVVAWGMYGGPDDVYGYGHGHGDGDVRGATMAMATTMIVTMMMTMGLVLACEWRAGAHTCGQIDRIG